MGRYALITPRRFDPDSPQLFRIPDNVLSAARVVRLATPYTRRLTGNTFSHLLLTEIGLRYVVGIPFDPRSRQAAFCNGLVQVAFGEWEILIEGRFDQ
jgi:hypothetical protein